mgnify:CR=1 FL=1
MQDSMPPVTDMEVEKLTHPLTVKEIVPQDPRPGPSKNMDPVLCYRNTTPGKHKRAGKPRIKVRLSNGRCKYVPVDQV